MKEKKVEKTEEKKNGYRENNIRMIRNIKSEVTQKKINDYVSRIYIYEEDS